jgi:hypothetical protein
MALLTGLYVLLMRTTLAGRAGFVFMALLTSLYVLFV